MGFKMKGPGLPGWRKAKPHAFYKSKPLEGDGRPGVSPFQHKIKDHHLDPHEEGDSFHAQQTRRNAELAKDDYTTDKDVSLDKRFPDDLDGDGHISQYEAQKAANREIDVRVRDEFTLSQQNTMINGARKRHEKAYRNHLKAFRDEEGNLPPGIKENKQGNVIVANEEAFNDYFNSKWQTEVKENSLGYAYPNVYGQVTHYTDRTPHVNIAEIQLTNNEAIQWAIGGAIEHAPKDGNGNIKSRDKWTEADYNKFNKAMMNHREQMIESINNNDPSDPKDNIKISICDRLTPEFIAEHGSAEVMTPDIMKEKNLVERGGKIWYADADGDPDIRMGEYVPPNAWSSSGWGKKMADTLGLDPESPEYWNVANPKTRNEAKADGGYSTEVVAGTKDDVVGGGANIVSEYHKPGKYGSSGGQGVVSGNIKNATQGITNVNFSPSGNTYNYRDKNGKLHQNLSKDDMLTIKTGMNADEREQAEINKQISLATEKEKLRQEQELNNKKSVTSNFINSMPIEEDFFSGINEQENPKEWKKATNKYNNEYNKWHERAQNADVDWDQVNATLYPEQTE